mmetsp:Transcript_126235/g.338691  ORF Transcript_126235/g.338691 Transcript_126235/m.338691 type:complete len:207 (-) Transcript_126235:91-711(-)
MVRRLRGEVSRQEDPAGRGEELRPGEGVPGLQAVRFLPLAVPPRLHRCGRYPREGVPHQGEDQRPVPQLWLGRPGAGGLRREQEETGSPAWQPRPGGEGGKVLLWDSYVREQRLPGLCQGRGPTHVLLRRDWQEHQPALSMAARRHNREGAGPQQNMLRQAHGGPVVKEGGRGVVRPRGGWAVRDVGRQGPPRARAVRVRGPSTRL